MQKRASVTSQVVRDVFFHFLLAGLNMVSSLKNWRFGDLYTLVVFTNWGWIRFLASKS